MVLSKVAVLLALVAAPAWAEPLPEGLELALEADDQCEAGDEACALSARQLRATALAQEVAEHDAAAKEDWSLFGTTEKCCRCKSGTIGWSASGKCSFCKGSVKTTKSVSSDCTKKSKKFLGNTACANQCRKAVLLEEPAELVQTEERRAELESEEQAASEDEAIAEEEWSLFGTTEKCCRCKSGTIGWSASGKCSFCKGSVKTTKSVSSDCTVKSKKFAGNTVCANQCKKAVLLEEPAELLQATEQEFEQELQAAQEALGEDEALAARGAWGNNYGNNYGGGAWGNNHGNNYGGGAWGNNHGYGNNYGHGGSWGNSGYGRPSYGRPSYGYGGYR